MNRNVIGVATEVDVNSRSSGMPFGPIAVVAAAAALFAATPAGARWQVGACAALVVLLAGVLPVSRAATLSALRSLRAAQARTSDLLARRSTELQRRTALLSALDDAMVTLSTEGRIVEWNRAAEELYGYTRDEIIGCPFALLETTGASTLPGSFDGMQIGDRCSSEDVHLRKDGATVQVALTLARIGSGIGSATEIVAVVRDITEYKRSADFHHESKLESLGRLSAGLAHEINSPIQFVGDNARFLEEAYQELIRVVGVYRGLLDTSNPIGWMERQERVREAEAGIDFDYLQEEIPSAVAQTLEGIDRVSAIVRAMKTFSHPGRTEQVPADLNEALTATVTVTRHQVEDVADLHLDLGELPAVCCNVADLNQVFLNLIVNAADAIEETGRRGSIIVATRVDGVDAVVRISDTGGGIPDDVRPKIFDPFFTTKDVGRGSGQGLPLARGIVHDGHGGSLTLESVLGQGTTFTVRIPIDGLATGQRDEKDAGALLVTA